MTTNDDFLSIHIDLLREYSLNPEKLPKNRSPKWCIKFKEIPGGVDVQAAEGAFDAYHCSFDFSRELNGKDNVGAGLKGTCLFILQNNPETPLMANLMQKLCSNTVFETVSVARLMDEAEKNLQNAFVMSNAKLVTLKNIGDLILGTMVCNKLTISDSKVSDSGESNGQIKASYNFEKGEAS